MKNILKITTIIILFFGISACSEYQKLLKSHDYDAKYTKAIEYYEKEDYYRASTLLEDLINIYRGTKKGEEAYFYYAYSHFGMQDFIMAGYYFNSYAKTYPNGKHTEEAKFLTAYCYYLNSPEYSLDQLYTTRAIEELQLFLEKYPKSERVDTCNSLIDVLREKLEKKSYESAKMYYEFGDYKAAIVALNNSIKEYPDTKYREELLYLILRSGYLLAENSIIEKQKERYQSTIDNYFALINEYPETEYLKPAEKMYNKSVKILKTN